MEQMKVRWRDGTIESTEFPDENVVTFNYTDNNTLTDGAVLSYGFQNLRPSMVYVVQIEGRNRLGTSSANFIIETSKNYITVNLRRSV